MKLKEIIIKNFMPYKGVQTVCFPQNETQNVMLVHGKNGRGKTSFMNTIRWVLYGVALGRSSRVISKTNLINLDSIDEGDCSMSIVLIFTHDKKEYEIRRSLEKKDHISTPKKDYDYTEVVELRIDGEVQIADLIANKINQVMPEQISRFFLFDGELLQEYENLILDKSTQGEQIKEHIEQVLGVPAFDHAKANFKYLLNESRKNQAKEAINDESIRQYAEQQMKLSSMLESYENDLSGLEFEETKIQDEINDINEELKNTSVLIQNKNELDRFNDLKTNNIKSMHNLENNQRILLKDAWKDILHKIVKPVLANLKKDRNKIQESTDSRVLLDSEISNLLKIINDPTCTTCNQFIPDTNIDQIKVELDLLQGKFKNLKFSMNDRIKIEKEIEKLSGISTRDEGLRILKIKQEIFDINVEQSEIEGKIEDLEGEVTGKGANEIVRQNELRDRLVIQHDRLLQSIKEVKQDIKSNTKEQEHYAKLISNKPSSKGSLNSKRVKTYQALEDIFSQAITVVRESFKNQVEKYASEAFHELTSDKTYSGLKINDNYGLVIIDSNGRNVVERSSGYEQIVALALMEGLIRTTKKLSPLIMDTPFSRLDLEHRENILTYMPKRAEQFILLVHDGEFDSERDIKYLANRIGAQYDIEKISSSESRITRRV